jgi:hypothetical protein
MGFAFVLVRQSSSQAAVAQFRMSASQSLWDLNTSRLYISSQKTLVLQAPSASQACVTEAPLPKARLWFVFGDHRAHPPLGRRIAVETPGAIAIIGGYHARRAYGALAVRPNARRANRDSRLNSPVARGQEYLTGWRG